MIPTPVPCEEQIKVAPSPPPAPVKPPVVKRRLGLGWVMVAICAAAAGLLATAGYKYLHNLGNVIIIHFQDAQGLRPGADLRYRGVVIGRVTSVSVRPDLGGVDVNIALNSDAPPIARKGSRFWIVHPSVSMATGVTGLDTAIGDKYVTVLPASSGDAADEFDGVEEPPLPEPRHGSVSVVLWARPELGWCLRVGAPVTFGTIHIGQVNSVKIKPECQRVRAVAWVDPDYAGLVRGNSQFVARNIFPGKGGLFAGRVDLRALVGGVELKVAPTGGKTSQSASKDPCLKNDAGKRVFEVTE